MDHSVQQYIKGLSTDKIKKVLRDYQEDRIALSTEIVLLMLEILVEREPPNVDVDAAYESFIKSNKIDL